MFDYPIATFFLSLLVSQLAPNLAAEVIYEIGKKGSSAVFDRFDFTSQTLVDALRRSFEKAVSSISLGLNHRYLRVEFLEEKVVAEFANQLEARYLYPFYTKHLAEFDKDFKQKFRHESRDNCKVISRNIPTILQLGKVTDSDIQALLLPLRIEPTSEISTIETLAQQARISLIEMIRDIDGVDELFCDFLDHNNLLIDSIGFFFLNIVGSEQKVQGTLQHFNAQSLRIELSKLSGQLTEEDQRQAMKLIKILESIASVTDGVDQAFGSLRALTESNFARVLSEINEVLQGVDEISAQIEGLEKRLMDAVIRKNFEAITELGAELERLENRRTNKSLAQKSANDGIEEYKKGVASLESSEQAQSQIHFEKAEKFFRKAVENIPLTDRESINFLTWLGNSMTMQGKTENAISIYEQVINLASDDALASKELVKRLLELGDRQHTFGQFENAIATFEYALLLDSANDSASSKLALSLNNGANALWTLDPQPDRHNRDRCRLMMLKAIYYDPKNDKYHANLRVMQGWPSPRPEVVFRLEDSKSSAIVVGTAEPETPKPFFDVLYSVSFPDSLKYWIELFLPEFRELISSSENERHTLRFWWYEDGDLALENQLEALGIPVPEVAISYVNGADHYIVFHAKQHSEDAILAVGNLAHELSHEAFKALGASAKLPDWPTSTITHAANERIADLLAIYKGFGQFLLRSRKRIEGSGFEGDYAALTPIEIERLMRRDVENIAKARLNQAAGLKSQGKPDEANSTFHLLKQQWQRILRHDSTYDFGWFQLSVLCEWLQEGNDAVRAAQRAVNLTNNRKYREQLTKLKLTNEEDVRRVVSDGAFLVKAGKRKSASRLFAKAEAVWRAQLKEYPDVARVHFELARVLEWQERIPEAVDEYRLSLALDPSNDAYSAQLQKVLHAYEQ